MRNKGVHSSGVEPGRWVRSVLRGFIDPRLHSDPTQGADPIQDLVRHLSCYSHGKVPYIAGADPAFCLHTQISGVRPRMWGRTLQIWRSTKGGSDPAIGAGDFRLGGSDPASGVRPRNQSTVYKHGNSLIEVVMSHKHINTRYKYKME